jgi:hypothetical protein
MSLFQCDNCGCVDNTATSAQAYPKVYQDFFDWTDMPERRDMKLCHACGPLKYSDGTPTGHGVWHNRFKRTFLPKGKFRTAKNGNLECIATGEQAYFKYEIEPDQE